MAFKAGDKITIRPTNIDHTNRNWLGIVATVIAVSNKTYTLNYLYLTKNYTADFKLGFINTNFITATKASKILYGI